MHKSEARRRHLLSSLHLKFNKSPIPRQHRLHDLIYIEGKLLINTASSVCHTWLGLHRIHEYSLQYWNTLCQRSPPGKGSGWTLVILLLQTASSGQRTVHGCLHTLDLGKKREKLHQDNNYFHSWDIRLKALQLFERLFPYFPSDVKSSDDDTPVDEELIDTDYATNIHRHWGKQLK